jgi:hypothetical protein
MLGNKSFLLNLWSHQIRGETDQTRVERILAEMVNVAFESERSWQPTLGRRRLCVTVLLIN